jgi:hypothetical protein
MNGKVTHQFLQNKQNWDVGQHLEGLMAPLCGQLGPPILPCLIALLYLLTPAEDPRLPLGHIEHLTHQTNTLSKRLHSFQSGPLLQ